MIYEHVAKCPGRGCPRRVAWVDDAQLVDPDQLGALLGALGWRPVVTATGPDWACQFHAPIAGNVEVRR